jgi:hypothetical protein
MDGDELDLSIIEATDEYSASTKTVPDTASGNGSRAAIPVDEAEKAALTARIAHLEAELESWQRRTVVWRERALSAQALNEALNKHLEDLRLVIRRLPEPAPDAAEPGVNAGEVERAAPTTVVEWCNRVFRREFWTGAC